MRTGEDNLLNLVRRGGMIVQQDAEYCVYRSTDRRRGAVGVVGADLVDRLLRENRVRRLPGMLPQWVWDKATPPVGTCERPAPRPPKATPRPVAAPGSTGIERILFDEPDEHRRTWLAAAAARFLGDVERATSGQTVTMNWSFVPSGKSGRGAGPVGAGRSGLVARQSLEEVRRHLGAEDMALLDTVLVRQKSLKLLRLDLGLSRDEVSRKTLDTIRRLARIYDRFVAPQRGD